MASKYLSPWSAKLYDGLEEQSTKVVLRNGKVRGSRLYRRSPRKLASPVHVKLDTALTFTGGGFGRAPNPIYAPSHVPNDKEL